MSRRCIPRRLRRIGGHTDEGTAGKLHPCADGGAGQWVSISGTVHELLHVTITARGRATLVTHRQYHGVSGTGLVTGDRYSAVGTLQDAQTFGVEVEQTTVHADGTISPQHQQLAFGPLRG